MQMPRSWQGPLRLDDVVVFLVKWARGYWHKGDRHAYKGPPNAEYPDGQPSRGYLQVYNMAIALQNVIQARFDARSLPWYARPKTCLASNSPRTAHGAEASWSAGAVGRCHRAHAAAR